MAVTNNTEHINNNKVLSIQINLSGLSFCVLDKDSNQITHIENVVFDDFKNPESLLEATQNVFDNHAILRDSFTDVIVLHQNNWSTLVPSSIFNKDCVADYLKFNTKILATDLVEVDPLNYLELQCVYIPFTNINNYIFDKFGSFTFMHSSSILVDKLSVLEKNNTSKQVYVNISNYQFDLIIFEAEKLLFFNHFEYQTPEDILYYLLFTFEQLQLNPELIQVKLLGHVNTDDAVYHIIYKYIRHVSLLELDFNYTFKQEITHKHRYYNLISALS